MASGRDAAKTPRRDRRRWARASEATRPGRGRPWRYAEDADSSEEAPSDTRRQRLQRGERFAHRALPCGGDAEVPLALAAAFCRGFTEPRREESLVLEPLQRGVDGRHGRIAAGFLAQHAGDRHAIRRVAKLQNRQEDELFELADRHFLDIVDIIGDRVNSEPSAAAIRFASRTANFAIHSFRPGTSALILSAPWPERALGSGESRAAWS